MEPYTIGKLKEREYKVPLRIEFDSQISMVPQSAACLRLLLIETGAGILKAGERRMAFSAPALFCINEQEKIFLVHSSNLKSASVYFLPSVINDLFTLENIRTKKEGDRKFSGTEIHDIYWFRPFLNRDQTFWGQFSIGPTILQIIKNILKSISGEFSAQGNFWPCRSRSYFIELLFLIDRLSSAIPGSCDEVALKPMPGKMDEIILYLHNNYQKKVTIDELTKLFHINRTTLAEDFHEATGTSIVAYLNKLRVRLASAMLRDTMLPVAEIMERVGFNDQTHFGRVFKKQTGCSPGDYRDKFCWMVKR